MDTQWLAELFVEYGTKYHWHIEESDAHPDEYSFARQAASRIRAELVDEFIEIAAERLRARNCDSSGMTKENVVRFLRQAFEPKALEG